MTDQSSSAIAIGVPLAVSPAAGSARAAGCALAQPGILFEMLSPADGEAAVPFAEERLDRTRDRVRSAAVSELAAGVAIGACVAAFVVRHRAELCGGSLPPAATHWLAWRDCLPVLVIGSGLGRLAASDGRQRTKVAMAAAVAIFLAAVWQIVGVGVALLREVQPMLLASVFGAMLGSLIGGRPRGSIRMGPAVALAAALAALLLQALPRTEQPIAVGLAACLAALSVGVPVAASAGPSTHLRRVWPAVAWSSVLIGLVCVACGFGFGLPTGLAAPVAAATIAALLAIVCAAAVAVRPGIAVGATAALLVGGGFAAGTGVEPDGRPDVQELARDGRLQVVYRRHDQEVQLLVGGEVLAAAGPDRTEEPLQTALLHGLLRAGDRLLMLGAGTGRVACAMLQVTTCQVEWSPSWPASLAVRMAVLGDGPVVGPPIGECEVLRRALTPWSLATLPDGSRQVLVLGDQIGAATRHRATVAFQRQLRRVAGLGVVCQPLALDRIAARDLVGLLSAAARAHPWNGLYAVGSGAVLVSASARPQWRPLPAWSSDARWALHRAHLGGPDDLDRALLGTVRSSPVGVGDDGDVARVLAAWLEPPDPAPAADPGSVLTRWRQLQAELQLARSRLATLGDEPAARLEAQRMAARFLPLGTPAPSLQAALGLADADGVTLQDPALASRCAHAMDPTFFTVRPAVLASLPTPLQVRGALEDLWRVEASPRLAVRCAGQGPMAVALRARFASCCARALIESLADGPLDPAGDSALRELADPFVLEEAARVVVPSGRWLELLSWWRGDLPLPAELARVAAGGAASDRIAVAEAMRGRRDPSCFVVLADFLVDDDVRLRRIAAEVLRMAVGELVPYDPDWSRSARSDAADQLRGLHNRKP